MPFLKMASPKGDSLSVTCGHIREEEYHLEFEGDDKNEEKAQPPVVHKQHDGREVHRVVGTSCEFPNSRHPGNF